MLSSLVVVATILCAGDPPAKAAEPTAAQQYKNIQVLKDVPASELDTLMDVMAGSLGVDCRFCHAEGGWDSDENHTKDDARAMLKMTLSLQKNEFDGKPEVTCWTCHHGDTHPATVPAVGKVKHERGERGGRGRGDQKFPAAAELFDKFTAAIGGADKAHALTTRVVTANRIGDDGVSIPEVVKQKAPGKLLQLHDGSEMSTVGSDGEHVWFKDGNNSGEVGKSFAEQIRREARFHQFVDLKTLYPNARVVGKDVLGDEETDVFVVEASKRGEPRERLYFDIDSGLLVRHVTEERTMLGPLPMQIDYDDWRDVDGVKLPFVTTWSTPGRSWRRIATKIEHGAKLDDAEFAMPAAKK